MVSGINLDNAIKDAFSVFKQQRTEIRQELNMYQEQQPESSDITEGSSYAGYPRGFSVNFSDSRIEELLDGLWW